VALLGIGRNVLRLRFALSEEDLLPDALVSSLFPQGLRPQLFLDPETEVRVGDSRNSFNPKNDSEVLQTLDRLLVAMVVSNPERFLKPAE